MTDQHNPNIPALGNVIADDIPDIKENLEYHKDCFQAICDGWSDNSTASLEIKALTIDTGQLTADAVDGTKIADDSIDSEHYVDGSIDAAHLASSAVETAKIKDANVTTAKIADSNVTTAKIADANVTATKLASNAVTTAKIADANVTAAKLKTSTGSVSTASDVNANFTLPGGEYGFYPRIGNNVFGTITATISSGGFISASYVTNIYLARSGGSGSVYANQRYVTSSGEVYWIFILRDKTTKDILSVWQAPDHPCFGNGGKPQLVPHPFPDFDETTQEIIVINPSKEQVLEMKKKTIVESETEPDKDMIDVILGEYDLDETKVVPWPIEEVTVGLPPEWEEKATGESITPIKKVIPKPNYVKTASLRLKKGLKND